jgi:hypothetical protein
MKNMKLLDNLSVILLLIGGICWGLIGAFSFDLVGMVFGVMSPLTRIIFVLVGLSAIYRILLWAKARR